MTRREFLGAAALAGSALVTARDGGAADGGSPAKVRLGFDNFSIRSLGWKAPKLLDHAASLKADVLLISDLDSLGGLDDANLREVRARAADKGIELQVGTGSICPTSKSYDAKRWGPAEDHLRLLIRAAKGVGSPVARCYVGTGGDRAGGIERHIAETVKVCRAVRSEAVDAGVKISIENHAGDQQAWELAGLVEEAGKDFVGVTLDVGNAIYTLDDPLVNLEILGPYAATTGMRDTALWETEKGVTALWVNMGEGIVDWKAYLARFRQVCPKVPFVLEVLSHIWPRDLNWREPRFWDDFPRARAPEFARFLGNARKGGRPAATAGRPEKGEQTQQMWDLEHDLRYCREILGLGLKA